MLALLAAVVVMGAPIRLGTPGLTVVGIEAQTAEVFSDHLAKQLELSGVLVTGKAEIAAVLGLERQRQLMGCAEDSASCLAELAGALGVDGLLTGTLGKLGTGYVVNLKIVDREARSLAVASGRAADVDALLDYLDATAVDLSRQTYLSLGREPPPVRPPPPMRVKAPAPAPVAGVEPKRRAGDWWPLPVAVGVAALLGGATCWTLAKVAERRVSLYDRGIQTDGELEATLGEGRTLERVAWVFATVSLGLLGFGAVLGIAGPRRVMVAPVPGGGGAVLLSGALP